VTGAVYRQYVSPAVKAGVTTASAEAMRQLHPLRLQYELPSDRNPLMQPIAEAAELVRSNRRPAAPDNPFVTLEKTISRQIVAALDGYRDARDRLVEQTFLGTYSQPLVQSVLGLGPSDHAPRERPGDSADHKEFVRRRIADLTRQMTAGGRREGAIRALVYCGMADSTVDERAFAVLHAIREEHGGNISVSEFKALVREQYFMLLIDEERAVAAIPELTGREPEASEKLLGQLRRVLSARGPMSEERERRLARIASLLGAGKDAPTQPKRPRSVA
jgi:hypothetical protein